MTTSSEHYDYIIVGAGSAGCVLASRLATAGDARVLLIEAGGRDWHPAFHIPKAIKLAMESDRLAWRYETLPFGPVGQTEVWPRGKTLGGSSAINGLVWNRGHAADFDAIERLGNPSWGWETFLPIYCAIEDHELGRSDMRGAGGPLHITIDANHNPVCEAAIASAAEMGLMRVDDVNASDEERIGYTPANIKDGRRVSARAFLRPLRRHRGLDVALRTRAVQVLLDGERAVGVRAHRRNGRVVDYYASSEVILSLGSIATPQLLELSGIGSPRVLEAAGVKVRVDSPNVGERAREQRAVSIQWRLKERLGHNHLLDTPLHQAITGLRYLATRRGPLATVLYDLIAFCKTQPESTRPDAMFVFAPFSIQKDRPIGEALPERSPGASSAGLVLRPQSQGSVHITSSNPYATPAITPGYLTADYDRRVTAAVVHKMRELAAKGPLAELIDHESFPGPSLETDEELVDFALRHGNTSYHTIGTCALGPAEEDVLDPQLRVRGVDGLRVVDGSALPLMAAGNPNAPIMAMAWHAGDLILGRASAD